MVTIPGKRLLELGMPYRTRQTMDTKDNNMNNMTKHDCEIIELFGQPTKSKPHYLTHLTEPIHPPLPPGPNFMALLTVSTEPALTEAGNSVLTASVFQG